MKKNKSPSILVVGPDGVGKTTLVKKMSEMTSMPTFKCPSEKQIFKSSGAESLHFDYMLTYFIEQTGVSFISDRAYICEAAYSAVFNRKTNNELLDEIDKRHCKLGTKILYLYSSVQPFEEDDIVPSEKYFDVKLAYDYLFDKWCRCECLRIDTARMLKEYKDGKDISTVFAMDCLELMNI